MTGHFENDQYNIGQRDHGFIFENSNCHKCQAIVIKMFSADVRQMIDRYFYLVVLILTSVRKLESFSKLTDDLLFTFSIQSL